MVNFVDHKSNYSRIFLAQTKDVAAKQFEAFLIFFEKRFNCRIHMLRTDGGAEYANVDLFCKKTGVTRQVSEAGNQASNGKAEGMHRTVLNLAWSMMFACGLPLHFWGACVADARVSSLQVDMSSDDFASNCPATELDRLGKVRQLLCMS